MRYVTARISKKDREDIYRIYLCKSVQGIPAGKYMTVNFEDLIYPELLDERSGDEIALEVINRLGLVLEE